VPCLRRGEYFDYYFITNLLLSFLSKNFKHWSTFGKVMCMKVGCLKCCVCRGTVQLKGSCKKFDSDIWRQKLLYQHHSFYLLTDAMSDWLNVNHVHRRFVTISFFFVATSAYSQSGFLLWPLWISFCSPPNDANVTGCIFLTIQFRWLSFPWTFA